MMCCFLIHHLSPASALHHISAPQTGLYIRKQCIVRNRNWRRWCYRSEVVSSDSSTTQRSQLGYRGRSLTFQPMCGRADPAPSCNWDRQRQWDEPVCRPLSRQNILQSKTPSVKWMAAVSLTAAKTILSIGRGTLDSHISWSRQPGVSTELLLPQANILQPRMPWPVEM